jgi:hypothetical protein
MARGIITAKPSTAVPKGKISVTDGKSSSGGPGSDPSTPGATTTAVVEVGSEVDYSRATSENVGDVVDFTTDSSGQVVINSIVATGGKVIGNTNEKLTVAAGEVVVVTGTVDGKVTVNGGTIVITSAAKILSKLESTTANSYIIANGTTISAKVEISGASFVSLKNTKVEGKVTTDGTIYTAVRNCVIEGSLDVTNTSDCHCSGNTVDGNTNTPNNQP